MLHDPLVIAASLKAGKSITANYHFLRQSRLRFLASAAAKLP